MFEVAKSFGELYASQVLWKTLAFMQGICMVFLVVMLYGAKSSDIPVMVSKDGQVIEVKASMDQWKDEAWVPVAKGFVRRQFSLLLRQDYRYYEQNVAIAQEQMSDELRASVLKSIKDKDVFRGLRVNRISCIVEILEKSLEATKQKDGFDVSFDAIVESSDTNRISKRERLTIKAHLVNTPRTTVHPEGLLLDSFHVEKQVGEPYPQTENPSAQAQGVEILND